MITLHEIINENPTWFTAERSLFKAYFLRKFCVNIQDWVLRKMEHESLRNLENQQLRRIQQLLRHAYKSVPFWNKLLNDLGILPQNVKSLEDFQKISITPKTKFKTIPLQERISHRVKQSRFYSLKTSCSTGTPTSIMLDKWASERIIAIRERGVRWVIGFRQKRDKFIRISPRNTFYTDYKVFEVRDFMHVDMIKEELFAICKKNECVIFTNPSTMFYLTQLAERDKQNLALKGISLSGEDVLVSTIEYIERIFQCTTMNRYTCSEVQTLASTCKYGKYHTNPDQNYVEVIDTDKNISICGKAGKIVVTDFNNYVMPLIRYEVGDIGILYTDHHCKCVLLFPIIEFVGRDTAIIKLPNGEINFVWKILSPLTETNKRSWIIQFQVIRKSVFDFDIFIVTTNEEVQHDIDLLATEMQKKLGINAKIKIIKVPRIHLSDGEKLRSYISHAKTDEKDIIHEENE